MSRLMAEQLLKSKDIAGISMDLWKDAAQNGDVEAFVTVMNGTFNQFDYIGFPLTQESHVRAAVHIYLMAIKQRVTAERHYSKGRSDLEFDAGDFHWVMEFKYLHKDKKENPDTLLAEALNQIKSNRYGEGLNIGNKKLLRIGLLFDGEERQFVRYGVA